MNNPIFQKTQSSQIQTFAFPLKQDMKKEFDVIFSVLSRNDPEEITKYFKNKSETFPKFELNEETLLKLRHLRKFRSFPKINNRF